MGFGSIGLNSIGYIGILFLAILYIFIIDIRQPLLFVLVFLAVGYSGVLWSGTNYRDQQALISQIHSVISMDGKGIELSGTLSRYLYKNESTTAYRLDIDNIDNISTKKGEKISLLIHLPSNLTHTTGDSIMVKGNMGRLYERGIIDGFARYTFLHGIHASISTSSWRIVEKTPETPLMKTRDMIEKKMVSGFPRDVAAILLGMTIGNVDLMSKRLKDDFRASGLTHILVVSGSNITFLILFISGLLRYVRMKRVVKIVIILTSILLYSNLVGWDVPVIRATIMGLLGYLAIEYGSRLSSISILFFLGCIYLIFSPFSLLYDAAFGLSFGATIGIILYYKKLSLLLGKVLIPQGLASIVAVTLSASVGTIPAMIYYFGTISTSFLFANVAIALVIGWILFFSIWYLLFALFFSSALYPIGILIYIPASFILWASQYFGAWGMWDVPHTAGSILTLLILAYIAYELSQVTSILSIRKSK